MDTLKKVNAKMKAIEDPQEKLKIFEEYQEQKAKRKFSAAKLHIMNVKNQIQVINMLKKKLTIKVKNAIDEKKEDQQANDDHHSGGEHTPPKPTRKGHSSIKIEKVDGNGSSDDGGYSYGRKALKEARAHYQLKVNARIAQREKIRKKLEEAHSDCECI